MSRFRHAVLLFGVALVALGASYFVRSWMAEGGTKPAPAAAGRSGAEAILAASFPDLQGKNQPLAQWRGKVLIVNFWATWCPACREEIPEFIKFQEKYRARGVVFVGIALDEKDKVQAYSAEVGINYPVLLADLDAIELSRQAGNRLKALPFTAIIDPGGNIVHTELGGLSQAKLESIVSSLL